MIVNIARFSEHSEASARARLRGGVMIMAAVMTIVCIRIASDVDDLANMDAWMDGWMDGWMGGWMDGWMEGWMDG